MLNYMLDGLIKKTEHEWVNIFITRDLLVPNVKVELDLSNYATKLDLKNATGVDASEKVDLDSAED